MKRDLAEIGKKAGIYGLSNVVYQSIPLLLLPILTSYLAPAEYGIIAMYQLVVLLLLPFIGIGTVGVVSVQFVHVKKTELACYIGNSIILIIALTIGATLLLLFNQKEFSSLTGIPEEWSWTVPMVCAGQSILAILLAVLQMQGRAIFYGLTRVLMATIEVSIALFLIIYMKMFFDGRLSSIAITMVLAGTFALIMLAHHKFIAINISKKQLKEILAFGSPLIFYEFGFLIILLSDRIFITNMLGVDQTGVYFVGAQIGMVIALIHNSLIRAWAPWLFKKLKQNVDENKILIVRMTYIVSLVMFASAAVIGFLAPVIISIFAGEEYQEASKVVAWLAMGSAFVGVYKFISQYVFYLKKTVYLTIVALVSALLNIVLNYFFIQANGITGAAQATMLSYIFALLLTFYFCQKLYPMPYFLILTKFRNRKM